jgi:hypothetical protein
VSILLGIAYSNWKEKFCKSKITLATATLSILIFEQRFSRPGFPKHPKLPAEMAVVDFLMSKWTSCEIKSGSINSKATAPLTYNELA